MYKRAPHTSQFPSQRGYRGKPTTFDGSTANNPQMGKSGSDKSGSQKGYKSEGPKAPGENPGKHPDNQSSHNPKMSGGY